MMNKKDYPRVEVNIYAYTSAAACVLEAKTGNIRDLESAPMMVGVAAAR